MNFKRATALALSLSLLLGAAACGKTGSEAADTGSKTSAELLEEENAILGAHQKLWDQVFASMDKSSPATAENYGDVLLSAVENCKDKLSDEDYQTLKSDAESIRSIEEQIAALPADDSAGQSETAAASAFPEFTGKDLDGNAVDSSLFANNAYTVVNFWFSGCKPCVAELGELDKLNQTAKQQGGEGESFCTGTFGRLWNGPRSVPACRRNCSFATASEHTETVCSFACYQGVSLV